MSQIPLRPRDARTPRSWPAVCAIVARHGEQPIHGIASGDAYQQDPGAIVSKAVREARPGGIFVFHMHGAPDAPATAEALPRVIRTLHRRGYRLVTLSRLFGHEAG